MTVINGIINVYKEKGFTSHDVVAKLRGILKQKKIGHTGTLDPDAEGVLPVCLGKATKLCDMLTEKDKTYQTIMLLGVETDTQDTTGIVKAKKKIDVDAKEVARVIMSYIGGYQQIPPMYSALKVNGKKLYELAREGKEVERKPRNVYIHNIEVVQIELPYITMKVSCSKGTYIRTLCHDIGQQLGCGGCMDQLLRTNVGRFQIQEARTLSEIEKLVKEEDLVSILVPIDKMFKDYPAFIVDKMYYKILYNGNSLKVAMFSEKKEKKQMDLPEHIRVYDQEQKFIGVYQWKKEKQHYKPVKIFME